MILVPYWPIAQGRVQTLQIEGLRDILLTQGGSMEADAEADTDAWRDSLAFLAAATKQTGGVFLGDALLAALSGIVKSATAFR
jgi:hypothetical protein